MEHDFAQQKRWTAAVESGIPVPAVTFCDELTVKHGSAWLSIVSIESEYCCAETLRVCVNAISAAPELSGPATFNKVAPSESDFTPIRAVKVVLVEAIQMSALDNPADMLENCGYDRDHTAVDAAQLRDYGTCLVDCKQAS